MRSNNLKTQKVAQVTVWMLFVATILSATQALAQSKQYQRKSAAPADAPVGAVVPPKAGTAPGKGTKPSETATGTKADDKSDKLDISELEQKYWAPKDTDFSVVQNRTYTKANRVAATLSFGPSINNLYSEGYNTGLAVNYYFSERSGVEFQYIKSDLKNSDSTKKFLSGVGGGIGPDFNRPESYYGIGYNWVPFYAKMSFLGQKIIYFDMQFTPTIGIDSYEQQNLAGNGKTKNAFAYGIDITQYYFFQKSLAIRLNYHNSWSQQDEVYYKTGADIGKDSYNTTTFMFGLTWFMNN